MKGIRVVIEVDPFEACFGHEVGVTLHQVCNVVRDLVAFNGPATGGCVVYVDAAGPGQLALAQMRAYGIDCSPLPKPARDR